MRNVGFLITAASNGCQETLLSLRFLHSNKQALAILFVDCSHKVPKDRQIECCCMAGYKWIDLKALDRACTGAGWWGAGWRPGSRELHPCHQGEGKGQEEVAAMAESGHWLTSDPGWVVATCSPEKLPVTGLCSREGWTCWKGPQFHWR